jgi:hypothetical protein
MGLTELIATYATQFIEHFGICERIRAYGHGEHGPSGSQ